MLDIPVEQIHAKPKKRKTKIMLIIFGIIVVLAVIAILFIHAYLNRSKAQLEGKMDLPGLKEEVTVTTDDNGVPHIQAANEHDLYMAQGYVQAQDRLLQMELSRRQASGMLSEVVGAEAVNTDKYFRTLGLRRAAEASYEVYTDEAKEVLKNFAEGVNTYRKEAIASNSLPVEFLLMGNEPDEWTPIDSLTIGKFMAFDLGGHWERQAFNFYALHHFDEEKAYELFPHYPKDKPTIIDDNELDMATSFEHAVIPHAYNGSNNWVVGGEKTASGNPLLANDPHLGLDTPAIWYQMHLQTEGMNVEGVIFAGVPGIILGHNEDIAWGVTNTGPDVQQLYMERRNPDAADEFLYEDEWEKAKVIDEPIKVKDEDTIDYQVTETRHGPIISDFAGKSGQGTVLSLKWTALDPTTELEAILDMDRATNWEEFETGLEKFLAPAQNFVFASKDGTIAYKANGNIPIYEDPDDALLPLEGWDKENDWKDYIPFDELPRVVNPDKDFIATANNKIASHDYPYHISNSWAQPYRYERISEVLEAGDDFDIEDMQNLQMDQMDLQAREFVPMFLKIMEDTALSDIEQDAMDALADWGYQDDSDLSQPLIFHTWMEEIEDLLYADDIPASMMNLFGGTGQTTDELLRKGDDSIWITDNGGLEEVLHTSLQQTLESLSDTYGEEVSDWAWGDFHQVAFPHPLSDVSPILAYFFNPEDPKPVGGSSVTPMATAYDADTGIVSHGAPWRFVIDTSDMSSGYHIVGPGQAGHFKSKWYHDQIDDWVDGNYHETNLDKQSGPDLILQP